MNMAKDASTEAVAKPSFKQRFKAFFTPERSRKTGKIVGIVIAILAIVTILALSIYSIAAYAPLRVNVDLNVEHQTLGGFGASSAWI